MDSTVRVGLVGYGLGGAMFHAPFIFTTPGLELSAIVTRSAERREQAARDYPGARVIAHVEQVWERDVEVDVVVISTPNRTHVPLALAALGAGLHVVVDKPLALSVKDGRALMGDARRRGLILTVYQNRRWDGDFQTVRRLVADGALGEPLRFESRFDRWRSLPKPGWRERGTLEEGAGILFDLGSHLIDQALMLFGPLREVYAELDRRRPGVQTDDDVFLALTHSSGVHSHLYASALVAQPGPRFRVLGTAAAYTKWGTDVQDAVLRAGARPDSAQWGIEPVEQWGTLGVGDDLQRVPTERGHYGAFYAALVRAIRDGGPAPVSPADAVAALEVIEAARDSAEKRSVIRIGESGERGESGESVKH